MAIADPAPVRDGSTHLWLQVAHALADRLQDEPPGTRLPSEAQLREAFGVSRVTLRQSLVHLREAGVVSSRPGVGWFTGPEMRAAPARRVARPVFEPPGRLLSFTEMARSRGFAADSILLERTPRACTLEESEGMGITPGAEVVVLRRVRRLDRIAIAVDQSTIPAARLPRWSTIDFEHASLHDALRDAGAAPARVATEVEAKLANAEVGELLGVPAASALLVVRQSFFDAAGKVVEWGVICYRADRYRYRSSQHSVRSSA